MMIRSVEILTHWLEDDGRVPNNPGLPLLIVPGAIDASAAGGLARRIEEEYGAHGWGGMWRWGVYAYEHYHSCAHEVLTCFKGEARIRFGGEAGPVIRVTPGDMVVIPAGVGHRNLASTDDFTVVGAYPPGQSPDLCLGRSGEIGAARLRIAAVPLPGEDPLFGAGGPLIRAWKPVPGAGRKPL